MHVNPNNYNLYIHDFECYIFTVDEKPVWYLSCTFKSVSNQEITYFEISNRINQKKELVDFLKRQDIWLLGYNNKNYDNVIAQLLIELDIEDGYELVKYIHDKTQVIFDEKVNQAEINLIRNRYSVKNSDLMTMYYQNNFQKPLKMLGVMLKHDLIYEGNIESNRNYSLSELNAKSIDDIFEDKKKYNINDVEITYKFFEKIKEKWNLRIGLTERFGMDLYSDSESSIANKIGLRLYIKETFPNANQFEIKQLESIYKKKSTQRDIVYFKDAIVNVPKFETTYLNYLLDKIMSEYWSENHLFNESIHVGNVTGKIGIGGIHLFYTDYENSYNHLLNKNIKISKDTSGICYKTIPKNKTVREIDVASLYPATWINSGMYPEHLSKHFIDVYTRLRDERIKDKKQGRTFDSNWKKLVLNSLWGKTKNKFTFVYDPKVSLMITMTGQLMILQLIEKLLKIGIKIILSNTDSVVVEFNLDKEQDYYSIIKEWEGENNYELEETIYQKYFARDVNCYLGLDINNKIKAKNDFSDEIDFNKGMDALIVAKSVKNYFLNNIPVEKTIHEEEDINNFLITQKPDKNFKMEYTTIKNGQIHTKTIQRINRWYITKRFGKLFKTGINKNGVLFKTDMSKNYYVRILNDFNECCNNYEINYDYYIERAKEFINKIENNQIKLF